MTKQKLEQTPEFVEGEVLVKYKKNKINLAKKKGLWISSGKSSFRKLLAEKNLEQKEKFTGINTESLATKSGETTAEIIENLENEREVDFVQPNFVYSLFKTEKQFELKASLTTDFSDRQWYLDNDDDYDLNMEQAWSKVAADNEEIIVAVIDTGADLEHLDLEDNLVSGYDFIYNDSQPEDGHGHGTHVAGIIAALHGNNIGIEGLGKNKVKVMPLRIFDADGGGATTTRIIAAIEYAGQRGVKIINASFGQNGIGDRAMYDAIKNFDGLFVVAAGNEGNNHDTTNNNNVSYPAGFAKDTVLYDGTFLEALENVIAVSASNDQDQFYSASNYGKSSVHLAAPGQAIYSTYPISTGVPYAYQTGTSMASPMVAAAVGLVWLQDDDLTKIEVKETIIAGLTDICSTVGICNKTITDGRLNIGQSLAFMEKPALEILLNSDGSQNKGVNFVLLELLRESVESKEYYLERAENAEFTTNVQTIFDWTANSNLTEPWYVWDNLLEGNKTYYYRLKARKNAQFPLETAWSDVLTVTTYVGEVQASEFREINAKLESTWYGAGTIFSFQTDRFNENIYYEWSTQTGSYLGTENLWIAENSSSYLNLTIEDSQPRYLNLRIENALGEYDDNHFLSIGPWQVDNGLPEKPVFSGSTVLIDGYSDGQEVEVSWQVATDLESGLEGYLFAVDQNESTDLSLANEFTTEQFLNLDSFINSEGQWFLHLRSKDKSGNLSESTTHIGPFNIDQQVPEVSSVTGKIGSGSLLVTFSEKVISSSGADILNDPATYLYQNIGTDLKEVITASYSADNNQTVLTLTGGVLTVEDLMIERESLKIKGDYIADQAGNLLGETTKDIYAETFAIKVFDSNDNELTAITTAEQTTLKVKIYTNPLALGEDIWLKITDKQGNEVVKKANNIFEGQTVIEFENVDVSHLQDGLLEFASQYQYQGYTVLKTLSKSTDPLGEPEVIWHGQVVIDDWINQAEMNSVYFEVSNEQATELLIEVNNEEVLRRAFINNVATVSNDNLKALGLAGDNSQIVDFAMSKKISFKLVDSLGNISSNSTDFNIKKDTLVPASFAVNAVEGEVVNESTLNFSIDPA